MAVAGCSGDEPVLTDDNIEISDNGTLVTDHLAFTTKITGFNNTPEAARSEIMKSQHKEWVDEASQMFVSTTYVDQKDGAELEKNATSQGNSSRGFGINSNDWQNFDNWFGPNGVRVSASYVKDGGDNNWIHDQPFKRKNDKVWRSDQPWFWPRGASKYTIYAWTPVRDVYAANGTAINVEGDGTNPILSYSTPDFAGDQQDIMVAKREIWPQTNGQNGPLKGDWDKDANQVQPLQFTHIMAGLRFRVAIRPGRPNINRIDVYNIPVRSGKYSIKNGSWDTSSNSGSFGSWTSEENNGNKDGRRNNFDSWNLQYHTYNDFMEWEQTYMLIPQTFASNTYVRIYWCEGTGSSRKYTDVNLNGITLKAGTILYVDIQEPSIFEEGMKSARELGGTDRGARSWPEPEGGYVFLRLYEGANGNYYKTPRRVCFDWSNPSSDDEANKQWNANEGKGDYSHFGNRLNLNVLTRIYGGGENYFYGPEDMRQNFFVFNREVTYRYKCRKNNSVREDYFRVHHWSDAPESWSASNINQYGAPWNFMGGELDIVLTPDRVNGTYPKEGGGTITFTPYSTASHPINWPRRICLGGSVNKFPYLIVEPFEGTDATTYSNYSWRGTETAWRNIRSNRDCYLKLIDANEGIYEGWNIEVWQRTPSMGTRNEGGYNNGLYCIPAGWFDDNIIDEPKYNPWTHLCETGWHGNNRKKRGFGVLMLFFSTMHGSYGHHELPADEYESRLGVVTNISYEGHSLQNSGTIDNIGHTYNGSYIKLRCGIYHMTINMTKKTLVYEKTGDLFDNYAYDGSDKTPSDYWKSFRHPHKHVRNIWYDVITWGYSDWYEYRTQPYYAVPTGSYYYTRWKDGSKASTAE